MEPPLPAGPAFKALAHVVLRDDRRFLLEECVAAGVVAVIVGVDDEADRLVGNALERSLDLLGQGSVFVVDHDDAVVTHRRADVSARSLQHVDAAGNVGDLDLDLAEILALRKQHAGRPNH